MKKKIDILVELNTNLTAPMQEQENKMIANLKKEHKDFLFVNIIINDDEPELKD